ncbi:MAG: DUF2207 domain-containing protein [Bacteroidales bacterium]|nr:DUF2207 domain-containing protein [Bacteroidales bacterium]
MKRFLTTVFLTLSACLAAQAQEIRDIDETVVLQADGSARITQVWDVNVVSGTEFYLPFDHLGPLDIRDLAVSEGDLQFVSEGDDWDTDRTLEQKRGRCGIVRKSHGVELCWGQGSYGDHVWTVSYTVDGLVMKMGEYNGLYFSFVNPGLSAPPQHVKVTLVNGTGGPEWTDENVKVWGFRSQSEIFVEDGTVRAESIAPFDGNSAMTVLVRFDPDLFAPAVDYGKDFEKIHDMALRGSDYKDKVTFMDILAWILVVLGVLLFTPVGWVVLVIAIVIYYLVTTYVLDWKFQKGIFGSHKIKGWYRDVPLEGNIPASYYVLSRGGRVNGLGKDSSKNLIGAYFLKWVLDGVVEVLPDPNKKIRVNLSFVKKGNFPESVERDLYVMVREASGANLILEAGELEKWSKKSFSRISDVPHREQTRGLKWFQDRHYVSKRDDLFTKEGQEQARHVIEFKNFLNDFTLSKERGAIEVTLWRDYLVFAALFGIADKVARQFEKLYPAEFTQFLQGAGFSNTVSLFDTLHVSNSISASAMRQAMTELAAHKVSSSGGHGSSGSSGSFRSFGGGGHFSSGGGGHSFGGSRGGGSR